MSSEITPVAAPSDELELSEVLREASEKGLSYRLQAGASKQNIGRHIGPQGPILSLAKFSAIKDYQPAELVLTAKAATPMTTIEAALQQANQMLAFAPPNWSRILTRSNEPSSATSTGATLGGVMMTGFSGPRRLSAGAARDHCLGFRGVSGRGEIIQSGAAVVKNVTGYDLPKLMVGSYGTLSAITEIIVKTLPQPEQITTLILPLDSLALAQACFQAALSGSIQIAAASLLPTALVGSAFSAGAISAPFQMLLRLEGTSIAAQARSEALQANLKNFASPALAGQSLILNSPQENRALWQAVRDLTVLEGLDHQRELWRFVIPPAKLSALGKELDDYQITDWFADWGGGQIFLVPPLVVQGKERQDQFTDWGDIFFPLMTNLGGHATRLRASLITRQKKAVFQPLPQALAMLNRRVKLAFDPKSCLNRGLLYPETASLA